MPLICRTGGPGGSKDLVIPGWEPPGSSHMLCPLQELHPWMKGMVGWGCSQLRWVSPAWDSFSGSCQSLCLSWKQVLEQAVLLPAKPHHVRRCPWGCCSPAPSGIEEKAMAASTGIEIFRQGWLGFALGEQNKRCFN